MAVAARVTPEQLSELILKREPAGTDRVPKFCEAEPSFLMVAVVARLVEPTAVVLKSILVGLEVRL